MSDIDPIWTIVASGKGGIGKSLYSLGYIDLCDLNGIPVDVFQLDDQVRLEKALGRPVTSLDLRTASKSRQDPKALTKSFAPLAEALETMMARRRCLHLDVGATQQHALFDYAALTGLDDDLQEFGVLGIAFVPVTADGEAIIQAAATLDALASVLPSLRRVVVLNERDGAFADLPRDSDAGRACRELLLPKLGGLASIRMPFIPAASWQCFERASCRLLDVVAMDTPAVMSATGLTRPEAKLARGDVQAFFDVLEEQVAAVVPAIGRQR